ncbi:MAG: FecR domain-containing protein, partial [Acidobacteriota bacterium]|nr:FecR domain-containing protein [Acidobacteriota bacterium]
MRRGFGRTGWGTWAIVWLLCGTFRGQSPSSQPPAPPSVAPGSSAESSALAGESQVRIVRLSQVLGDVSLDRQTGLGYEKTMANMPVVQGARLQTHLGAAAVELEDGSALRLSADSELVFPKLALEQDGTRNTVVRLLQGKLYVSLMPGSSSRVTVLVGDARIQVPPGAHLRLRNQGDVATLSVYAGTVPVESGTGVQLVGKKQTLTLPLQGSAEAVLSHGIADEPFDAWDKQQMEYQKHYGASSFAGAGYGISDLNYYGSVMDVDGCGAIWQPYFVDAAWNPYSNGVWTWYPGSGYSWVSPYPWGWTPFHTGSWVMCPGVGWGWQPGGGFVGLNNVALVNGRAPFKLHPPLPPVHGKSTLVPVNTRPLVLSRPGQAGSLTLVQNSAGLGVPRGPLGNLGRLSHQVAERGIV